MEGHRFKLFRRYGARGLVTVDVCEGCRRADPRGRDVAPGFLSVAPADISRCQHPRHLRRVVRAIAAAAAGNGRRGRVPSLTTRHLEPPHVFARPGRPV